MLICHRAFQLVISTVISIVKLFNLKQIPTYNGVCFSLQSLERNCELARPPNDARNTRKNLRPRCLSWGFTYFRPKGPVQAPNKISAYCVPSRPVKYIYSVRSCRPSPEIPFYIYVHVAGQSTFRDLPLSGVRSHRPLRNATQRRLDKMVTDNKHYCFQYAHGRPHKTFRRHGAPPGRYEYKCCPVIRISPHAHFLVFILYIHEFPNRILCCSDGNKGTRSISLPDRKLWLQTRPVKLLVCFFFICQNMTWIFTLIKKLEQFEKYLSTSFVTVYPDYV